MKEPEIFKQVRKAYPSMKPTMVSGFTLAEDKGVFICGLDENVVVVVEGEEDINKLMMMCQLALSKGGTR